MEKIQIVTREAGNLESSTLENPVLDVRGFQTALQEVTTGGDMRSSWICSDGHWSWDPIVACRHLVNRLGLSQVIFKGAPVIIKGLQKEEWPDAAMLHLVRSNVFRNLSHHSHCDLWGTMAKKGWLLMVQGNLAATRCIPLYLPLLLCRFFNSF